MNLKAVRKFKDLSPRERAQQALMFGAELKGKRKALTKPGRLPAVFRREKMGSAYAVLERFHRKPTTLPSKIRGLRAVGAIEVGRKLVEDLVLTSPERKRQCRAALARGPREKVDHLALRQLGVGMLDDAAIPRLCSAYAYWQATGASHAVIPILSKSLESKDPEEFNVAAHCLGHVRRSLVKRFEGTADDDKWHSPRSRPRDSMTVIIHGTFARDQKWYKPRGDFHQYIKNRVYSDVYSARDYFFWSGRYSDSARRAAARKLIAWCNDHPAGVLRFIAHSHGANVVNIATQLGLQACTLMHLSPPVHKEYLPQIPNVSSQRFFTIRAKIDLVVWIDGGQHDYRGTRVAGFERRRICATFGHSSSHESKRWTKKNVPTLVRSVC